MRFCDIPGHDNIKRRLCELVDNGHMPHALLLEGKEGSAKFALAMALAQYIQCNDRHDGDSCGHCQSCRQMEILGHYDVYYMYPVVKKNSKPTSSAYFAKEFAEFMAENPFMGLERWQKFLKDVNAQPAIFVEDANEVLGKLGTTARSGRNKVVVMWMAERMREEAANKLLKIIEEPYADTFFILTTNNPRAILPTIYSRCQRIAVPPYSDQEVADIVAKYTNVEPETAVAIATTTEGNAARAIAMATNDSAQLQSLDFFTRLMRGAYAKKVSELRRWADELGGKGREANINFYNYCSHLIRENFILNIGEPELNTLTAAEAQFSQRFSPFINERNVEDLLDLFNRGAADIASNGNARIVAFDTAIQIIMLLRR